MEAEDTEKFAACIASVAAASRTELDDATVELYFQALEDVPIHLVMAGAVEVVRSVGFFPTVAEWRRAVDTILDRGERRELPGQQALPGTLDKDWRCPDCDNTGWRYVTMSCDKRTCWEAHKEGVPHDHTAVTRCTHPDCLNRRQELRARRRRYSTEEA